MAKNLARRMDIPAYDTYPAPAAPEELRMRSSQDAGTRQNPALNDAAGKVGSVVGRAVGLVKELPNRLDDMKQRFGVIPGGSGGRPLAERASEVADSAKLRVREARERTTRLAHDNPVQFILGAAAGAFALGVLLRVWRSHRG